MKSPEMLKLKSILVSVLACVSSASAFAEKGGHGAGNGGTALVCNQNVSIPEFVGKTMLADFAEVYLLLGLKGKLTIEESNDEVDVQIERALKKVRDLDEKMYDLIQNELWRIKTSALSVGNYHWPLTQDIGAFPMPNPEKSCELKNSVNYLEDSDIQMNDALIGAMSKTHRAGLWVHEAVYSIMRSVGTVSNAVPARRMTALLFSKEEFSELLNEFIQTYFYRGETQIKTTYILRESRASADAVLIVPVEVTKTFTQILNKDGRVQLLSKSDWVIEGSTATFRFSFDESAVVVFDVNKELIERTLMRSQLMVGQSVIKLSPVYHSSGSLLHVGLKVIRDDDLPREKPSLNRFIKGWLN